MFSNSRAISSSEREAAAVLLFTHRAGLRL
jgi:hypothetical protein